MSSKLFQEKYPVLEQFQYNGITFGFGATPEILKIIPEFTVRKDDVVLLSYPKSGTRWMAEIVSWLVITDENIIETTSNIDRVPYLEMPVREGIDLQYLYNLPSTTQRMYCSHLKVELAPRQLENMGKVIIVLRNPKDLAVSYYYFYKNDSSFGPYTGTWDEFLQAFQDGSLAWGSYFDWVKSWWSRRHHDNVLFVYYENLKKDQRSEVKRIADFLGKSLSEERMRKILERTSFSHMKTSPFINIALDDLLKKYYDHDEAADFMRKGVIGDWKNHFTVSQNEEFEELIKDLGNFGLVFEYEQTIKDRG